MTRRALHTKSVSIKMSPDLLADLKNSAKNNYRSVSGEVRDLLRVMLMWRNSTTYQELVKEAFEHEAQAARERRAQERRKQFRVIHNPHQGGQHADQDPVGV